MEGFFGYKKSNMPAGVRAMLVDALYSLVIKYLHNPALFHHQIASYAHIVNAWTGLSNNIWGLNDGTLQYTCRPIYHQKLMYSSHKRHHGMKLQSVMTPDGLIACMFGAINGNRHDSYMMMQCGLLQKLCNLMPATNKQDEGEDHIFASYTDLEYPQSAHIFGGCIHPAPGSREALWNTLMSSVCESLEWGFAHINRHWAFLDNK